jgi:hypothetical protein
LRLRSEALERWRRRKHALREQVHFFQLSAVRASRSLRLGDTAKLQRRMSPDQHEDHADQYE